ncbi:MAG: 50S ribosomal protein L11, large subunit ribosomal protein L11 [candidate division WS6 bacterium GW2011_GWC1_33_20]|uniref:Large ribosomal subunit protein uL11 n=1 Tax=candidate division WS6 bacterium GW2011_GWC1_33_20 TaxID=1619089 RepID=A0A0G0C0M4_9BACT|nr:MAG: 50S ribosomal protein L11, large subunit ribosomal protein L11 [candidate division WS6 bacterium GW2011_GWC1_33_20]OGC36343.1 MAG: 50S ribosomal protein L11 [candidate division WS6 bacterium RIFOXYB1_FULL_33_15]OGC38223.1 MAG: 50S ribosomal protein L11 [candidate division WS6 bacterium RIFOXYC1_FULL_33_9]HBB64619.1 50S ribosomal protein L11 [Patescibacteria group bacterium]
MAKPIKTRIKITIPAGQATPAPPIGPTLAPYGISTQEFCAQFNEKTREGGGILTPVVLTIYDDRSFDFITKTPPTSELIRRELKIKKGSARPNLEKVGKLTKEQIKKIVEVKMPDLNTSDPDQAAKIIAGTAKQMGIDTEI